MLAIEKGEALARIANSRFVSNPNFQLVRSAFEDWETDISFDLFVSAQAFHWIEKEYGIQRIKQLLRPGGSFALIWQLDRSQDSAFWQASNAIYEAHFPPQTIQKGLIEYVAEYEDFLSNHPDVQSFSRHRFPWQKIYDKESYLGLLRTFSSHMTLEEPGRTAFFQEIGQLIDQFGGKVIREYESFLLYGTLPKSIR